MKWGQPIGGRSGAPASSRTAAIGAALAAVLLAGCQNATVHQAASVDRVDLASPEPAEPYGTYARPYPIGAPFTVGDWTLTVDAAETDATEAVLAENPFNTRPDDGRQYVMWRVVATYRGEEAGLTWLDLDWTVVGSAGNTFAAGSGLGCGVVPDSLSDVGEVSPGVTVVGNVCAAVATDQVVGAVLFVEEFGVSGGERVFVKLR